MSFRHDYFNFDINVWVFVYVFNNEQHLGLCFDSIKKQSYKLFNVLVIDDCSTDSSLSIIDKFAEGGSFIVEKNEASLGPAFCKLKAFDYVKKNGTANDIFIELPADGAFCKDTSIEEIVISSIWNKAWFVYGPLLGQPCLQFDRLLFGAQYYYAMNIFLCEQFSNDDFIVDANDRLALNHTIISKCLDLCSKRSHFHPVSLIKEFELKKIIVKERISSISVAIPDTLHILIHAYFKHYNLPAILKSIDATNNREVIVHVINSNTDRVSETNSLMQLTFTNIKLVIFNSSINRMYYSHLTYIRRVMKTYPSSYAIILDEEHVVPTNWINDVVGFCRPLTYACCEGLVFNKTIKISDITFKSCDNGLYSDVFHYGKLEGSVLDMSLVLSSTLFKIDFKLLPFVEDLWISFISKQLLGKEIININKRLTISCSPPTVSPSIKGWITKEKVELLPKLVRGGFIKSSHINLIKMDKLCIPVIKKEEGKELSLENVVQSIDGFITLVVMNCHRSDTLKNIILPFYDLNCSHLINQIIVYHAKKATAFEYIPVSKTIELNNIYNEEDEKRYALFNRFIQPAKFSKNECVLIIDDDVVPDIDRIVTTYRSWAKNKMNLHGSSGRFCSNTPTYNYVIKHIDSKRVPIILTSFVMASLDLIKYCISEEHKVYDLVSTYKPKWNGEDIFLSLCAVNLTKQHNFVVGCKYEMAVFKRDNFAISGDSSHVKCRTELCNKVCELYDLDKRDTLTNYRYLI